ncbi:TPA: TIGR03759 family integrating conjugative element protein [Pseudomonas aeruginosa]
MKRFFIGLLLASVQLSAWCQTPNPAAGTSQSRIVQSRTDSGREIRLARDWGLRDEEWDRYRTLMEGPLGIYSPNLDPLTALGIEARSDEERRRYAELQVQAESRRVEKLLVYQRAYDEAWQRLYPGVQRVNLPNAMSGTASTVGNGRMAVFVRDNCPACEQAVKQLQASGQSFDLYMVGSRSDDERIRAWAQRVRVDPAKVRARFITLNHDAGRWLSLGVQGELPAVVQQVNGQWQRLP